MGNSYYPGDTRDPFGAAMQVASMDDETVQVFAKHDPDTFRTVAKELILYQAIAADVERQTKNTRADALAGRSDGWRTMESAPRDGVPFLVHYVDLVDEYDEDDHLVRRAVPTPAMGIASQDEVFGLMDVPYQGRIVQGRRYTHWQPLPPPPSEIKS